MKYKIILLTEEEVEKRSFKMQEHPDAHHIIFSQQAEFESWSNMVVKTKKIYISILGKIDEVCWYFDGMANRCLIHLKKPYACRNFFCKRARNGKTKETNNTNRLFS